MKNLNQERLHRQVKQYHSHNPWRSLDHNGLYVPHQYPKGRELSWWDDVGFVLSGRRVMVWWVHPRMTYADAIDELGLHEAGPSPSRRAELFDSAEKQWKKVGRSRKKVIAYRSMPASDAQRSYYSKLNAIRTRLETEGVDLTIRPSISVKTLSWCVGVDLCIPVDVRTYDDVRALVRLARQLLKSELTLNDVCSGYQYGRENWQSEKELRKQDRVHA